MSELSSDLINEVKMPMTHAEHDETDRPNLEALDEELTRRIRTIVQVELKPLIEAEVTAQLDERWRLLRATVGMPHSEFEETFNKLPEWAKEDGA